MGREPTLYDSIRRGWFLTTYIDIFGDNYFLNSRVQFWGQRKEDWVKRNNWKLIKILDKCCFDSFLRKCVRILVSFRGLLQNPRVCFSYHVSLEEKYWPHDSVGILKFGKGKSIHTACSVGWLRQIVDKTYNLFYTPACLVYYNLWPARFWQWFGPD